MHAYHRYMKENHPGCVYLFPSNMYSPLTGQVYLDTEKPITRMTVHNVVTLTKTGRRDVASSLQGDTGSQGGQKVWGHRDKRVRSFSEA